MELWETAKGIVKTVANVKDGDYGEAIKTGVKTAENFFEDDDKKSEKRTSVAENSNFAAQNTSTQKAQNPEAIVQIVCQTLGLSQEQIPAVMSVAQAIAPKDKDGKPVLTIDAITAGAQNIAQLSQYAQQMNMYA